MKHSLVSKITSKFQITLPKEVRESLHLEESDLIQWKFDSTGIRIEPVEKPFLKYNGILGNAKIPSKEEIRKAWVKKTKEKPN